MNRLSGYDLRPRYGHLLAKNLQLWAGAGWRDLITEALDQLADTGVRVTVIRERFGTCQIIADPNGAAWASGDAMRFAGNVARQAWEQAARTCETCGRPGTRNRRGTTACRCDDHQDEL
jgi:hypothetical protein